MVPAGAVTAPSRRHGLSDGIGHRGHGVARLGVVHGANSEGAGAQLAQGVHGSVRIHGGDGVRGHGVGVELDCIIQVHLLCGSRVKLVVEDGLAVLAHELYPNGILALGGLQIVERRAFGTLANLFYRPALVLGLVKVRFSGSTPAGTVKVNMGRGRELVAVTVSGALAVLTHHGLIAVIAAHVNGDVGGGDGDGGQFAMRGFEGVLVRYGEIARLGCVSIKLFNMILLFRIRMCLPTRTAAVVIPSIDAVVAVGGAVKYQPVPTGPKVIVALSRL